MNQNQPFSCCPVCAGLYLTPLRKQHMAIHALSLPVFLCEQCQMVFNKKLDLAKHRVDQHGERKFKCKYCPKRKKFSSEAMLFFHLKLVHGVRRRAIDNRGQRGGYDIIKEDKDKSEWEVEVCTIQQEGDHVVSSTDGNPSDK